MSLWGKNSHRTRPPSSPFLPLTTALISPLQSTSLLAAWTLGFVRYHFETGLSTLPTEPHPQPARASPTALATQSWSPPPQSAQLPALIQQPVVAHAHSGPRAFVLYLQSTPPFLFFHSLFKACSTLSQPYVLFFREVSPHCLNHLL